eukprot:3316166-Karenia_brevis.AAC.1
MAFVAPNPFWKFLSHNDIAALSTSCVVCCRQRKWGTLQALLLDSQAEDMEDAASERLHLLRTASGDLVPLEIVDERDDGDAYRYA